MSQQKIKALQSAMEELVKVNIVFMDSQPKLIQLSIGGQRSV
jgi:hypothetical protein